jgi:C-terminal processing protease CtpA/Prc
MNLDPDQYGLQDIVRGRKEQLLFSQTPGENPRMVPITRNRITGNVPVEHTVITTPDGKRIGYLLLVTFEDSTVDDQVASALNEMTADAPLDGLILDNRMNAGGSSTVLETYIKPFCWRPGLFY